MTIKYIYKSTTNTFYENIKSKQDFINLLKEYDIINFIMSTIKKDHLTISFLLNFYHFKIIIFETTEILNYIKKDIENNFKYYYTNIFNEQEFKLENNYDYFDDSEDKLFLFRENEIIQPN